MNTARRRGRLALLALVAVATTALATPAASQSFAGTWVNDDPANASRIQLVLTEDGAGGYSGSLTGAGTTVPLAGVVRDGMLVGRAEWSGGMVVVEAELAGDELEFTFGAPNPDGSLNYEQATAVAFVRLAAGGPAAGGDPPQAATTNLDGDAMSRSPLARQWAAHLVGKRLTQMNSHGDRASGYRRRRDLHLCSSGEFQYTEKSSVHIDTSGDPGVDQGGAFGGASGGDSGTGQWRVLAQGELVGLDLRFGDGRHWQVRLEQRNGETYVDGVRTYVTPGDLCR